MMRRIVLLLILLSCGVALHAKPVALFYLTDTPDSIRSFLAHEKKIDLLVPTWYSVDADGLVTGAPNTTVLDAAHRDGLPVMPIVALFGKKLFHDLAASVEAQQRMNDALIRECKTHGYAGFQFDFENLNYLDRDGLTAVVQRSADAGNLLNQCGLVRGDWRSAEHLNGQVAGPADNLERSVLTDQSELIPSGKPLSESM